MTVGLALAGCAFLVSERREERSIPTWDGPTTSWTYDSGDYRERRIFDHWRCQDVNCDSAEEADI